MSNISPSISSLPASAFSALRELGSNLKTGRLRRGVSLRAWSQRLGVSVPTLVKMEAGEPTVAIGVYATALFMTGMHGQLRTLAEPRSDLAALEADVALARSRGARRRKSPRQAARSVAEGAP